MAYEPSKRLKSEELDMELDIRPVMNLMVVLIPLLIASAEWVKLGVIEVNVPPAKAAGAGSGQEDTELKEPKKNLGLKIIVTEKGITLANAVAILSGDEGEGPTIPLTADGSYDWDKLRTKLIELKEKITDKGFEDSNRAIITASADIQYQTIIDVMDKIQTYEKTTENGDREILPLFPEVNFGKMIQ